MKERLAEFVGVVVIALLLIVTVILFAGRDYKGPVISFSSEVTYYENTDEAILLAGVTAYDSKDGDVTDSLLIDSIIVLESKSAVKVIYIAKDSSNNITKVERFVNFAEASVPQDTPDNNTQESTEGTNDDNNQNETESSETESSEEVETESVTETTEPTTEAPETTTAAVSTKVPPVMVLEATEVTISVGSNFRVFDYVENITDDKDGREELFRQISVDGYYDTSTVGDYEIFIFCVDSDKNASNKESFIIHVREEGDY